ncbi:MAG TPA: polysaccharide deacetylase family protein [Hanamia sp.]
MIKFIFLFSLVYFLSAKEMLSQNKSDVELNRVISYGGIIRGDTTVKKIALVFTADEFGDGSESILKTLQQQNIRGSFFFTGNFYKNASFKTIIKKLQQNGNYLGSHSDRHLLYCDWMKRDSLLITHDEFREDLESSYQKLKEWNISKKQAYYFLPPYEWYNDSIAAWTKQMGLQLVNFSPGTRSNADYTYPEMGNKYVSSDFIMKSILEYEEGSTNGLNGFILLLHFGTDPRRTDKFYFKLPHLIRELKNRGYEFVRIDEMLN